MRGMASNMFLGDIKVRQSRALEQALHYRRALVRQGIQYEESGLDFLASWSPGPGQARVNAWLQTDRAKFVDLRYLGAATKRVIFGQAEPCYRVVPAHPDHRLLGRKKRLILSWCQASHFATDGTYHDTYFGTPGDKTPSTHWLLVSVDGFTPNQISNNITIIAPSHDPYPQKFRFAAQRSMLITKKHAPNLRKIVRGLASSTMLTTAVLQTIESLLVETAASELIIPYEAQAFQDAAARHAKIINPTLRVIGIVHSALPALPTEMCWVGQAIDELVVPSAGQTRLLVDQLGWPHERVRHAPSLRFRRDARDMNGTVFLPYAFNRPEYTLGLLETALANAPGDFIPPHNVRIHPYHHSNAKHQRFATRVEELLAHYGAGRHHNTSRLRGSIFIGTTTALLEALERGVQSIQITNQPLCDVYHPFFWPGLGITELSENVFLYDHTVPDASITLGDLDLTLDHVVDSA